MSAVLVTGGLGVNGVWVIRKLVEQGKKVVTYDTRLDTSLIKDIEEKVECVAGDILDLPRVIDTIKRYDVDRIIHLAAVMPNPLEVNPYIACRPNVEGMINILEVARLMDIKRLVYTSSQAVYDLMKGEYGHPTYKPVDEDYPRAPRNVYGVTKLFGEHMCTSYHRIYGVDFITLRFAWIYGPGKQARHGVLALHSKIIESAMLGRPLKIPQGADQIVDSIYCRDVASSIVLACFADKPEHRVFNIGTGRPETLGDMVKVLNKLYPDVPIEMGPGLDPMGAPIANYMVMNIERARKELGYRPEYDVVAAVKDYIETMQHLDIAPM